MAFFFVLVELLLGFFGSSSEQGGLDWFWGLLTSLFDAL